MSVAHIHYYTDEFGIDHYSKKASREALNIRHRNTFNSACKHLNIYDQGYYTESQLIDVLLMCLFVQAGCGRHSKEGFMKRKRTKTLDREFQRLGIPVELKIQWLQTRLHAVKESYGSQIYQVRSDHHYVQRA